MKIRFYKILLFSIVAITGCKTNQSIISSEYINLFPVGKNGKWGYANKNGELTIDYKFEKVTFFKGGRAAAKLNGKFGFINKDGEFFKKPKYDSIGYFNNERANVIERGKRFTIDRNGKKLKEGIIISTEGNPFENAKPLDYFESKSGKFVLNKKDFENEKRLDPTANFEISDFTFQ